MLKELKRYTISPRREIKEFLTTVSLHELAQAAINIFEPIYLYTQHLTVVQIILFYLGVYVLYFLLIPFGGRVAKAFGFEHTMSLGIIFTIAYFLSLIAIPAAPEFLYLSIILYALQKTFWWPAYHANFARYSRSREAGREIGATYVISSLTAAVGPLIGGALITYTNFAVLYTVAIVLILISVFPMLSTPERFTPSQHSWLTQMRYIFARKRLRRLVMGLGFGEELIALTIWPLFLFLLVKSALDLGALVAIATTVTVLATTVAARWSDDRSRRTVYLWGGVLNVLSWIGRPLLIWPLAALGIDTVYRTGKSLLYVPMYSRVYQDAKNSHVMLEVVSFEASLILGKIVTMLVLLIVFPLAGFSGAFVLAAVASLFYFLFRN
ncbi:MAG: MFS transporter [Candidatus Andersenbacteria bacterium]